MNENQWIWYRMALKDKCFLNHIEATDSNYMRFNFWDRTTKVNIELGKLYRLYEL